MPRCETCVYRKVQYAPYIKARVEICSKEGKCQHTKRSKKGDDSNVKSR